VRLCGVSPRALLCRAGFTREQQRGAGGRARRRTGSAAREIQGEVRVKGRLRAPWLRALEVGNIILGALVGPRRIGTSPTSTHAALSPRPVCPSTQPPNEGYLRVPLHHPLCCSAPVRHATASTRQRTSQRRRCGQRIAMASAFRDGQARSRPHLPNHDLHRSVSIHLPSTSSQRPTYHDSCPEAALA
jgi:hypothetical protein